MADERDQDRRKEDQQTAGQQGQSSEYGEQGPETAGSEADESMSTQGREGSFGGQSAGEEPDPNPGGGMSGQPIGGNDSNTGSGTALTAGYTPPKADGKGGFIGAQATGSKSESRHPTESPADATDGTDFAREGRGALDEEESEPGGSA
jgi:hypothetical protein